MELKTVLVWILLIGGIILYCWPIVRYYMLRGENRKGVMFSGSLSELASLLERHPWKEGQTLLKMQISVINEDYDAFDRALKGENVILFQSEEKDTSIHMKGHYASFTLGVENGILTVDGSSMSKKETLRRKYWVAYEVNALLRYITILAVDENDPQAEQLRSTAKAAIEKQKRMENKLKWLRRIFICIMLLAIALLLLYGKNKAKWPSTLAQSTVFPDFHYTKTVGNALSSFDPDGEWFNVSDKDALKDMGVAYAGWRGTCKSSGAFTGTENWPLTIYFEIEQTDDEGKYRVSFDQIEYGDYRLTSSNLSQKGIISEIVNMIYGNQDSVVVWTDAGLLGTTYRLSKKDPVLSSTTEQTPAVKETLASVPTSVPALTDTYSASAMGFGGNVTVTITVSEGVITSVVINGPDETAGLGSRVIEEMPTQIIAAQSADIDGISGATETSNAVKDALRSCLAQAKGGNASIAGVKDRSEWEYKDYVEYYGFDPANYGYYWYNEIESGPLEDFFEGVAGLVGETSNVSRLFQDTWLTDLTWDDFMGVWRTEGGITFTIDCIGNNGTIEDYTIDFSGNEGLGILGGWFSEDIYNIEGDFCGMSGSNGMSSYSVTYQYSTESPETNTWLFLEFVNSEGNTIQDSIPLVRDGVPCQ